MSGFRDKFSEEIDGLRRVRDELRVRGNLATKELRDLWEKAEKSWHELEGKLERVRKGTKESAENVEEAAKLLMKELGEAYRHIKRLV